MQNRNLNVVALVLQVNVFVVIFLININNNWVKNLILDVRNVYAKDFNLYLLDQKNVVCIGYLVEKILILILGDHHVNVIMVVRIINQIIHYVVKNVNVVILILTLLVYHVIVDGNYMKLYLKMNKKEEH